MYIRQQSLIMTYLVPVLLLLCAACSLSSAQLKFRDQPIPCPAVVNESITDLVDYSGLVISQEASGVFVLKGPLQLLQDVPEGLTVSVDVTRTEKGAITGAFLLTSEQEICSDLPNSANMFSYVINDAFGSKTECPLTAGTYTLEGQGLDQDYTTYLNDRNAMYIVDFTLSYSIYSTCIRINTKYYEE